MKFKIIKSKVQNQFERNSKSINQKFKINLNEIQNQKKRN